jgi:hypothetical protein
VGEEEAFLVAAAYRRRSTSLSTVGIPLIIPSMFRTVMTDLLLLGNSSVSYVGLILMMLWLIVLTIFEEYDKQNRLIVEFG